MAPFCSCPASLVSRKFFAVGPGCAKCFFFCCAPLGAATFRQGQSQKKNTTQGVLFLLRPRRKAREGEAPLGAGKGPEQKKKHHPGWFFLLRPRGKAGEGEAPLGAGTGPDFALAPCRRPTGLLLPLPFPGAGASGVFFLLWPRAGAQRGFSFACFSPGPQQKKKHPRWCFFFALAPCRRPTGLLLPLPFAGAAAKKKNTLGGVFVFAAAPRGRSLTHCGPGWRCLPLAGVVFFFLLRPRRVFLDNNKKCLGYYIGSKKTRRGHSKKKKTPLPIVHRWHCSAHAVPLPKGGGSMSSQRLF